MRNFKALGFLLALAVLLVAPFAVLADGSGKSGAISVNCVTGCGGPISGTQDMNVVKVDGVTITTGFLPTTGNITAVGGNPVTTTLPVNLSSIGGNALTTALPVTSNITSIGGNAVSATIPISGTVSWSAPYFNNSIVETATSGDVAAATATATLASAVGKTTYISGFTISGTGATAAANVVCTLTGIVTGTQSYDYQFVAGATLGNQLWNIQFAQPIPASGNNVAIAISCPSGGAGAAHLTINVAGLLL